MFIVKQTHQILSPTPKDVSIYASLSFTFLFLSTFIFSIAPKITENLTSKDDYLSHIGHNISTKDEWFFFLHEGNGSKKEMRFDEVMELIEETLVDLDKVPHQMEYN